MRPNPKLDPGLHRHLRELDEAPEHDPGLAARRISVWARFEGDLEAAKEAGLQVELVAGEVAGGTVAIGDLERVAEAEGVVSLRETETNRPQIKDSVPAIHADHSTISPLGLTGAGVIV